jgi:holo-[acyl-carrier protein] synthase
MTGEVVGVGTDLVDVERLRLALDRRPGLADRLFTAAEQADSGRHRDPLPHLAARFAAKESVMKALGRGMGAMSFTDIEVRAGTGGVPRPMLSGRAQECAEELGVQGWHLSLTHTASLAQAVAVASG